jgi:indolepyruvate ferredoxin oxidoreductase
VSQVLTRLNPENLPAAVELAGLHARIRGYGHVKLANLVAIKHREQVLAKQLDLDPATSSAVAVALAEAIPLGRSLKGIPVVTAR